MMTLDITEVAQRMAREIPKPTAKPPKPALSWRTLKPNQYLTNKFPFTHKDKVALAGTLWHILSVSSSSAELASVSLSSIHFTWTLSSWKDYFDRVRKPSKATLVEALVREIHNA